VQGQTLRELNLDGNLERGALGIQAKIVDFRVHHKAASRCGMGQKISCAGLTQAPQLARGLGFTLRVREDNIPEVVRILITARGELTRCSVYPIVPHWGA